MARMDGPFSSINFNFFQILPANLSEIIPNASLEAIDLILQLCSWDPQKRPTAEQSLQHPFFHVGTWVPGPLQDPFYPKINETGPNPNLELNLWDFGTKSDDCFLGLTLAVKPSVSNIDVNHVSQHHREEFLVYSGYQENPRHSEFWPLTSSNGTMNDVSTMPSLSSSYLVNSQPSLQTVGVPESSAFSFASQQPNLLDRCSFGPMMTISSSIQQGHFFE
ncbi:cyclin-dependent kinase F-3-like isoform X1 [Elaeis guineensis]|uniref:cyclin-dependent kinase F-3-like isoform X1 n=1 Tax=Elaeis guineensis var. tenera TaxID=51953 RepID=UPI003C6CCD3D